MPQTRFRAWRKALGARACGPMVVSNKNRRRGSNLRSRAVDKVSRSLSGARAPTTTSATSLSVSQRHGGFAKADNGD